ncbi:hypothetical protein GCM10028828_19010 [Corynebacterium tapiri]
MRGLVVVTVVLDGSELTELGVGSGVGGWPQEFKAISGRVVHTSQMRNLCMGHLLLTGCVQQIDWK